MTREEIIQGTLDWCNERRKEQGKSPLYRLPKGKRSDPYSCPCGRACGLAVYSLQYYDPKTRLSGWRVPMAVQEFIPLFDVGKFPEFELDDGVVNPNLGK